MTQFDKDTITVTVNVHGEVVEIEAQTEVTEVVAKAKNVVCRGNALPKALRERDNVVGKVNNAALAAILKDQERRRRKAK